MTILKETRFNSELGRLEGITENDEAVVLGKAENQLMHQNGKGLDERMERVARRDSKHHYQIGAVYAFAQPGQDVLAVLSYVQYEKVNLEE